ncbi:hypothetical protein ACFL6C_07750 [Myxococcota bacterium]
MSNNKPKAVFTVVESEKLEKPLWRRIGTAFECRDGSLNVLLDAMPTNGKLNIREDKPRGDEVDRA